MRARVFRHNDVPRCTYVLGTKLGLGWLHARGAFTCDDHGAHTACDVSNWHACANMYFRIRLTHWFTRHGRSWITKSEWVRICEKRSRAARCPFFFPPFPFRVQPFFAAYRFVFRRVLFRIVCTTAANMLTGARN